MLAGIPIVDAHVHAARLGTLNMDFDRWTDASRDRDAIAALYDDEGVLIPERFDAYFEDQGVDVALLLPEYSPRVTGIQAIEDMLPLVEHNPHRFRLIANVNPHLHFPAAKEVERQLDLGGGAQGAPLPRRLSGERARPLPGVRSLRRAKRAGGLPLWDEQLQRRAKSLCRTGADARRGEGFPRADDRARPRRPRLVVRRGGLPRADARQRLDRDFPGCHRDDYPTTTPASTSRVSRSGSSSAPTGPASRAFARTRRRWPRSTGRLTPLRVSSGGTRARPTASAT
jgi:hypothetical protein